MQPSRPPSQTAVASALMRAAHLLVDALPHVFVDDLALALSGWPDAAVLLAGYQAIEARMAVDSSAELARGLLRGVRAITVARARYAEDRLERATRLGVKQYVILGAGLDSFAYRRRDLRDGVRVFEVDHPATQAWKRQRLGDLRIALPHNLSFVPLDFERQSLIDGLRSAGFRSKEPALFSWMGVVNYLGRESIYGTLEDVAALGPWVELVFDYVLPGWLLDDAGRRMVASLAADMAARGEPAMTFFEPAELTSVVRDLGFARAVDFGPEEANARYFHDRTDGLLLPVPCAAHIMCASAGPDLAD